MFARKIRRSYFKAPWSARGHSFCKEDKQRITTMLLSLCSRDSETGRDKKIYSEHPNLSAFFSIEFTQKPLPKTNTGKVKRNVWN